MCVGFFELSSNDGRASGIPLIRFQPLPGFRLQMRGLSYNHELIHEPGREAA